MEARALKPTGAIVILSIGLAACTRMVSPSVIPPSVAPAATRIGPRGGSPHFKTLVHFNELDGCGALAGLVALKTTLYGTTICGGRFGDGEVYSITTGGRFRILHSFASDGRHAYAPVTVAGTTLYGTAEGGGKYRDGTVYSLDLHGKELWLYSFRHDDYPYAGLVDVNGTLYGTTVEGGSGNCQYSGPGCGTVFSITSTGKEKTIYSFKGGKDGAHPWTGLVGINSTLYGTTSEGGASNSGTVFSVTTSGSEHVLHSFGDSYDGSNPFGTLIAVDGMLYGTTEHGGADNWGAVYSIMTSGAEQIVYSFGTGGSGDALEPEAGLLYVNGELYGTTVDGGSGTACSNGCGAIYEVSTSGKERVLYSFQDGTDGLAPQSQLVAVSHVLYGTTPYGGGYSGYDGGTVFALTP